jgi:peptide/nickel transport system permease protein
LPKNNAEARLPRFLAAWVLRSLAVLLATVVLNFVILRLAPGDPAVVMAGEAGASDAAFMERIRSEYGLDRPLPVQLASYLGHVASGDLGYSYRNRRPVFDMIRERLPATLLLTGTAFVLALAVGTSLGVLAANRQGRWQDGAITVVALVFYAMPLFWVGLLLILLFSAKLGWMPAFGMRAFVVPSGALASALDILWHLAMPAMTLALFSVATYARLTRGAMLEVQHQDFVRTARAKGLPPGRITRAHVLRNALLPVITMAGIQAGQLVGGAIVVETVFAWPGIGRLAFEGLLQRDYNLLMGVFLLSAAMVMLFNLVTDLLYQIADPRVGARA